LLKKFSNNLSSNLSNSVFLQCTIILNAQVDYTFTKAFHQI
jgi:hypothetical protein